VEVPRPSALNKEEIEFSDSDTMFNDRCVGHPFTRDPPGDCRFIGSRRCV